ncbi:hypothetical protein GCM10008934_32070 [Virgibacillus salarius]
MAICRLCFYRASTIYKVKLPFMGAVYLHGWLVPQGYDLKASEPIEHLLAVVPTLFLIGFTLLLEWGGYCQLYAG